MTDLRREIRKKDPNFDRDSRVYLKYEFSNGRKFEGKESTQQIYIRDNDDS
jgi:hypothetical protein